MVELEQQIARFYDIANSYYLPNFFIDPPKDRQVPKYPPNYHWAIREWKRMYAVSNGEEMNCLLNYAGRCSPQLRHTHASATAVGVLQSNGIRSIYLPFEVLRDLVNKGKAYGNRFQALCLTEEGCKPLYGEPALSSLERIAYPLY